tara:strand:- start:407 stop:535 length:129 start_codon:yes stop_codon:yes gene_type:complete
VSKAVVSVSDAEAQVSYDPKVSTTDDMIKAIKEAGFGASVKE